MALQNAFEGLAVESKQIVNTISTNNSRAAATLAAGATYTGTGEDVSAWGRAGISIVSDNATDGTLYMEVSHDGVTYGGPPRTWSDTRFAQPHMWNIVEKYFRIRYVNGSTEATNLSIQTQYSVNESILLGHQLDETFVDETEAIATKSVLVGETPAGNYINIAAAPDGAIRTSIISSIINFEYDAVDLTEVDAITERWDYFTGGLAGTRVAYITNVYQDSSKLVLVSSERTLV